ncbi:hypothetical protein IscW_ISCW021187 [Ixodes scapularis]|uniref:Uncharacterized protein n=1 Tax=Ixodes scapularis TaxID=6945 RepID=B7Q8W2_IXOSC|nr:hypothetical protein IscW_ISCW021187 [Ixodes scapularis]|eukprot:XP_002405447.1 hypothetical protein IscW_ISCW021187 [Ixodes scapularis]
MSKEAMVGNVYNADLGLAASEEGLVNGVCSFFFLQQTTSPLNEICAPVSVVVEEEENAPFMLDELILALESSKTNTVHCSDGISVPVLEKRPSQDMNELLQKSKGERD